MKPLAKDRTSERPAVSPSFCGAQLLKPRALVPDEPEVTLRVEEPNQQIELRFPEGETPAEVAPLLDYLDRHARVIRNE